MYGNNVNDKANMHLPPSGMDFYSNRTQMGVENMPNCMVNQQNNSGNAQDKLIYHQNDQNTVPPPNFQHNVYANRPEMIGENFHANLPPPSRPQTNDFYGNRTQAIGGNFYQNQVNFVPDTPQNFPNIETNVHNLDHNYSNVYDLKDDNINPPQNFNYQHRSDAVGNSNHFYANLSNRSETIGGNIENDLSQMTIRDQNQTPNFYSNRSEAIGANIKSGRALAENLNRNQMSFENNAPAENFYSNLTNRSEAIGGNIDSLQPTFPMQDNLQIENPGNESTKIPPGFYQNRSEAIGGNIENQQLLNPRNSENDSYPHTSDLNFYSNRSEAIGIENNQQANVLPSPRASPNVNFYTNRSEAIGANTENYQNLDNERQISGQESDREETVRREDNRAEAVGANVDNLIQPNLNRREISQENLTSHDFYSNRSETIGANVNVDDRQSNDSYSRKPIKEKNDSRDDTLPTPDVSFYSNRSKTIGANVENLDDQQSTISSSTRKPSSREDRSLLDKKREYESRSRRYEESDYSDEERHDKYNKKYYSLRKDKSKRSSRYHDEIKREVVPGKNKDDFESDVRDSRPSSRSDSLHESLSRRREKEYRRRNRDRYRPREMFNPYAQFGFDPYAGYYQQYQYLEDLRRNNPQAYAQWYRQYYQQHATSERPSAFYGPDDRESVHSGRSSDNGKNYRRKSGDQLDSSFYRTKTNRLTPVKFTTSHAMASIQLNNLVKIVPRYHSEAVIEMIDLNQLLVMDNDYTELLHFPGPLIRNVTHKKTVVEYCEQKIRNAYSNVNIVDPDSYILMWELLILLLRQNGMVIGTDIAELLLKNPKPTVSPNRAPSVVSQSSSVAADAANSESSNPKSGDSESLLSLKEEEVTNKFREYLLYGSDKEALEWAMKHGLWGHALFLASKLDKRTYASVMMRFANGLAINDPLQTLYQLLSGKIPAAVTCIVDEKWGDWKPHLAMILSNSSQRPELNRKAISSLGDTLLHRGNLYAAQFCYLMAEVEFGKYGDATSKLILLGSEPNKPFANFATVEAIQMTEVYEYACSLNNPDFLLPEFQVYKYMLAVKLADRGLLEKSMGYLEQVSYYIGNNRTKVNMNFVRNVYQLADRFKYFDFNVEEYNEIDDPSMMIQQPMWLRKLEEINNEISTGSYNYPQHLTQHETSWQTYENQDESTLTSQQWQQVSPVQPEQFPHEPYVEPQIQQQNWYGNQAWNEPVPNDSSMNYQANVEPLNEPQEMNQPQISMPNQTKPAAIFDDEPLPHEKRPPAKNPQPDKKETSSGSTGWFGGIFSKLALKPKNQMKLPDDKNPSIVWDEQKKRWINVDEDNNEAVNDIKAPPKMGEIKAPNQVPSQVSSLQSQAPMQAPPLVQNNMFKLQKSRNLKKSYVDIFNPGDSSKQDVPNFYNAGINQQPNFFMPQPVNNPNAPTDFLTTGTASITPPQDK